MSNRHELTLSILVPSGQTPAETTDWVLRLFSYYHPRLEAKVALKAQAVGPTEEDLLLGPPPTPKKVYGGKLAENIVQRRAVELAANFNDGEDLL